MWIFHFFFFLIIPNIFHFPNGFGFKNWERGIITLEYFQKIRKLIDSIDWKQSICLYWGRSVCIVNYCIVDLPLAEQFSIFLSWKAKNVTKKVSKSHIIQYHTFFVKIPELLFQKTCSNSVVLIPIKLWFRTSHSSRQSNFLSLVILNYSKQDV